MTVFIAHTPADQPVAEALETYLERRGLFVERETGERGFRPMLDNDALIVLWSKDAPFALNRLQMEKRALDAWADGRLTFVKLDHHFAPVGLRDLDFIDASFEQQREFTWGKVANAVQESLRKIAAAKSAGAPAPRSETAPLPPAASHRRAELPPAPRRGKRKRGGFFFWLFALLAVAAGIGAAAIIASVYLANQIGPSPATPEIVVGGVNEFGARYGAPPEIGIWIAAGAVALALLALVLIVTRRRPRRDRADSFDDSTSYEAPPMHRPAPQTSRMDAPEIAPAPSAVFVSYARANALVVLPICEAVKAAGDDLWLDKEGIGAGDGWAGEIVRAIKGVRGVAVMCSKAAFESDHVKREVYLADRYKKRLLPVFIEDAPPPEDFEYFFAGVQWLKLHETPEADRGAVMARALKGV